MGKLIDERLHHECDAVTSWRAHRPCRNTQRHDRSMRSKIRNKPSREFVGRNLSARCEPLPFAKTHEVIAPRHQLAGGIHSSLHKVKTRRTIKIMMHVVFARPEQLDGRASELFRDP